MTSAQPQPLMGPEAARAFAAAFRFVRDLLRPPCADQWEFLCSPDTRACRSDLAARVGMPCPSALPEALVEYEAAYIETFEVGAPHPAVPLIESHYVRRDPVPRILHENILFYAAFGLRLSAGSEETSDHVRHQLEFLAYLFSLEAETQDPDRIEQIRRARSEYLERHLASWIEQAMENAQDCPHAYLRDTIELLGRVVHAATPAPAAAT